MPAAIRGGRKRKMRGRGILGDAWSKLKSVARSVHDKVKERKAISSGLRDALGKDSAIAQYAKNLGYGKPKRRRRVLVL